MKQWTPVQIVDFRKKLGLLQRDFAKMIGVTREYVNYLEKGVKRPSKMLMLFLSCLEAQHEEKTKEVKRHGKK